MSPLGGRVWKRGVILCSPHGYEEMCVHRIWCGLAEQLAGAGLPTLRFDYPGAGDSAGDDEEPGRVPAWLASIEAAAKWMRAHAGIEQLALVGLRLGATLAATAAQQLDVDSLALMVAPLTGKSYVRELKALGMLAPPLDGAPPPRPEWKDDLEAAGFVLTAETIAALSGLDLLSLQKKPAARVLVLHRPDAPVDARLPAKLRALGAEVSEELFAGYPELMHDAQYAVVPVETFAKLAAWLQEGAPAGEPLPAPPMNARLKLGPIVEEPVFFGAGASLFGVRSSPEKTPGHARPAILFLNTGANHHIGSNRMSVALCRRLARSGLLCLRFDLAGMGDSPVWPDQPDTRLYSKDYCADVRAALDWAQGQGHRHCIVVGLCSGAFLGFHTAIDDPRIVGQVLINPQRFTWNEGDSLDVVIKKSFKSTRFYLQTAIKKDTWQRALSGEVNLFGVGRVLVERSLKRAQNRLDEVRGRFFGSTGEKDGVARGFFLLSDRGVETMLVYSAQDGGLDELDAHLGKGGRKLDGRSNVRIVLIEGADHTLTARWARERFAQQLEAFLAQH